MTAYIYFVVFPKKKICSILIFINLSLSRIYFFNLILYTLKNKSFSQIFLVWLHRWYRKGHEKKKRQCEIFNGQPLFWYGIISDRFPVKKGGCRCTLSIPHFPLRKVMCARYWYAPNPLFNGSTIPHILSFSTKGSIFFLKNNIKNLFVIHISDVFFWKRWLFYYLSKTLCFNDFNHTEILFFLSRDLSGTKIICHFDNDYRLSWYFLGLYKDICICKQFLEIV